MENEEEKNEIEADIPWKYFIIIRTIEKILSINILYTII